MESGHWVFRTNGSVHFPTVYVGIWFQQLENTKDPAYESFTPFPLARIIQTSGRKLGKAHLWHSGRLRRSKRSRCTPQRAADMAPVATEMLVRTARQITERYGCSRTRRSSVFHGDSQSLATLATALISRAVLSNCSREG
jgi:hypothetical protein